MLNKIKNIFFGSQKKRVSNQKIFCIGKNKTGTTTVMKVYNDFEYVVGNQREAELLNKNYYKKDFEAIIEYCKKYEAFQDVPFSWPNTYKYLNEAFHNSKFILTVRDNEDVWYESLVNFQTKLHGGGKLPTVKDLKNFEYVYKGWAWENRKNVFGFTENDNPYDKEKLVSQYVNYNQEVRDFFKDKPSQFIEINVSKSEDYFRLCKFLNKKPIGNDFPWENKTTEIRTK